MSGRGTRRNRNNNNDEQVSLGAILVIGGLALAGQGIAYGTRAAVGLVSSAVSGMGSRIGTMFSSTAATPSAALPSTEQAVISDTPLMEAVTTASTEALGALVRQNATPTSAQVQTAVSTAVVSNSAVQAEAERVAEGIAEGIASGASNVWPPPRLAGETEAVYRERKFQLSRARAASRGVGVGRALSATEASRASTAAANLSREIAEGQKPKPNVRGGKRDKTRRHKGRRA
jgi:hypothetical protein